MARKNKNENVAQIENVNAPEAPATKAEPTTPAAKAEAKAKPICVVPGCGRESKIRGLCGACCTAARKAIKDGKTTWATLESLGLAVEPKHKGFGGEPGVFAKALKNALGGERG